MKNKQIDISVIVPVYNVEEYIEECLDSLHKQTKKNIEIIIVDDGSPDKSVEIAKQFVEKYDNFILFQKKNGGLGDARNYGVKHAHGKYIAFVDSDDVVSEDMYELMFEQAEKNKSELVICNVARIKGKKVFASDLHNKIFEPNVKEVTHIKETPSLIYDTTSWNKLILKSFWDRNNFSFPVNVLYEDIPVIIPMHYLTNKVSLVKKVCYFWRIRDGISKSITQNTDQLKNFDDRLKVLNMVNEFFDKNNFSNEMRSPMINKILTLDLKIFIDQLEKMPRENAIFVVKKIKKFINENNLKNFINTLPYIYIYI